MKKFVMLFLGITANAMLLSGPFDPKKLTIVNNFNKPVIATTTHGSCRFSGSVMTLVSNTADEAIDNYFATESSNPYLTDEKKKKIKEQVVRDAKAAWIPADGETAPCGMKVVPANGGRAEIVADVLYALRPTISGFSLVVRDMEGNVVLGKDPNVKIVKSAKDIKKVKDIKADTVATIDEAGVLHFTNKNGQPETINH